MSDLTQSLKRAAAIGIRISLLACSAALGLELYLRHSATHIVRQGPEGALGFVENSPDLPVDYTPRGRGLIPNVRVVTRNHYLSGRDIKMAINSLGFRDGGLPPVLREHRHKNLYLDMCHPRPEANDIIGRAIAGFIEEEMLPRERDAVSSSRRP